MSEQWYCPNCGLVEIKEYPYPQCVICASPSITLTIPPFVLTMQERIAEIEAEKAALKRNNNVQGGIHSELLKQIDTMQERIAALEAQIKTPATITLPNAEDCAGRSFVITNNGDRTINVELDKELPPTRAQLLAVAEALVDYWNAPKNNPVVVVSRQMAVDDALRAAGYLKVEGE